MRIDKNAVEVFKKNEINGEELQYLLEQRKEKKIEFLLVDVREQYEYDNIKIDGVDMLIPMSIFFEKVVEIEKYKETPIITQCKVGGRSAQAQRHLRQMGFKTVINLQGGISEYKGKTS